jgi:DNA polymerase III subunit delta'
MKWNKQSGTKSMPFSVDQALGYLCEANAQGRIAHSYLFSGPEGSGKRRLVVSFFQAINEDSTDYADFHGIEPESKSRKILVEQIRGLEASLRMHASRARVKFGVVYEADRLMPQAANAFLKTLEEPPEHSVLILVTTLPEALLETIRSRCIEVSLLASSSRALREEEAELVEELFRIVASDGFSVGTALKFARVFLAILGKVREKIEKEHADLLKKDQAVYKQTTDGRWLQEREEQLSALTESRYVKARANLILRISESLGDALRIKHGSPFLDLEEFRESAASLAGRLSSVELLKRLEAIESLMDYLSRSVQEALAVEVAFLKAFGPIARRPDEALAMEQTAR